MDDDNQPLAILSRKKYDVFISFRGEDTRANITSHLHKALKNGGIETYIDEDKLERGEEISKALLEAIEDSKISIVVFSKDYASSKWCLGELAHILQCVKSKTHIVVPVFYQVDPTDVCKQKMSYAEAFEKHNKDHYDDATISKWRDALTTAANHSGWDVSNYSNEAVVVHEIFNWVREKLRSISPSLHYSKQGIVGIDDSIADLNNLLSNSARVGICGMGGLGKTTLAQIVFNQSRHLYDSHCFFQNVREEFQQNRRKLKEEFFGQLSNEKGLQYGHLGSLKDRLRHKKLLVVLDDVDELDQYNCLLEDSHLWLNSESRLIITSRNHQVLRNIIGNDEGMIYNLKELKEEEALELFCLHAFKSKSPKESYEDLSSMFVKYAKGLPLALKVLGSHLYSKSIQVWQSLLNNIQVNPDQEVTSKLKISFDGLDPKQQSIFLDIACFFRGKLKYFVKEILDDRGEFDSVIEVLIDRCLITKDKGLFLQMHDLLQEMGQSIACGSNYNKWLENYTRLWKVEDICRFFRRYKGPPTIEGIFHVDSDDYKILPHIDDNVKNLDPLIFEKVPKLRLLKLSGKYSLIRVQLPNGLHDMTFPDELRHLEWAEYPFESLGSNFTPQNLAYFGMEKSQLKELWKENQDVSNLKYVILSQSKKLTCLPNFSQANLHQLCLSGCTSLVNLPPLRFNNTHDPDEESYAMHCYNSSMVRFINKRDFQYSGTDGYVSLTVRLLPTNLLDLSWCSNLTTLPEISGNIKFLCLSGTAIKELHPSIFSLKNLLILDLHNCEHLRELPNVTCELESLGFLYMGGCVSFDELPAATICKLKSLYLLDLKDCLQLKSFPEILEPMQNLKLLNLRGTGIEEMPSSIIENLVVLNILDLSECKNLKFIPTNICKLKSLRELYLEGCSQLKSFPEILEPMENMTKLFLDGTGIEVLPSSIENLVMLKRLHLSECENLKSIPTSIFYMGHISHIKIDEDPKLQILPYKGLPVEDSSETSTGQLLVTHDQPYICSSCTSTAILNLHYDGVDFTCCQCFLFYTIRNILATQYFMDEIFIGKCRDERGKDLIEAITPSSLHSGDSIDQSIESILPDLNLPATFLEDYDKCRDENEKDLIEAITPSSLHSGDSIDQSIESILPYLNLPVTFLEDYDECRDEKEKDLSRPSFCYRGDTITQWFAHQSMGSSLQLNLPFSSPEYVNNFVGFGLCIVVEFEATTLKRDDVLKCEYNLETKSGQNFQFYSIMQYQKATHFDDDDDDSNLDSSSNHQVFVWYLYRKDISMKRYFCEEEHYSFLLPKEESCIFEFHISKGTIKQCGVHLLYRQNIQLQDN